MVVKKSRILRELESALNEVRDWLDPETPIQIDTPGDWIASLRTWLSHWDPTIAKEFETLANGIYADGVDHGDLFEFLHYQEARLKAEIAIEKEASDHEKACKLLQTLRDEVAEETRPHSDTAPVVRYHEILTRYAPEHLRTYRIHEGEMEPGNGVVSWDAIVETALLLLRIDQVILELLPSEATSQIVSADSRNPVSPGTHVFIGHGQSPAWKDLRYFLEKRLGLECDEFNAVSIAGVPTSERLQAMLDKARFAFLVLTAEDEVADGEMVARANVIHETGLFQGRLGFKRAIVLLEEGCNEFSNIAGLGQIRFPKGKIEQASEEIRRVLEREEIIDP